MYDSDSGRIQRGAGKGQAISGPTLPDLLFYLLTLFILGDAFGLVFSFLSGNLPYPVILVQAIILVPLIYVFYYFRRKRNEPTGRDFNI